MQLPKLPAVQMAGMVLVHWSKWRALHHPSQDWQIEGCRLARPWKPELTLN